MSLEISINLKLKELLLFHLESLSDDQIESSSVEDLGLLAD